MTMILRVIRLFIVRLFGIALALLISFMLAAKFGAGAETDAFFLARRVVTGLVEALARGLSFIFVPIFVLALSQDKDGHAARRSLVKMSTYGLLIGSIVTLISFVFAPHLVRLLGGSFDAENLKMATTIFRIFLLSIPVCTVAMIATTYFQAQDQFSFPAAMRHMSRICLLVVLAFFIPPFGLVEASWAFSIGWAFTLAVLLILPFIRKRKLSEAPEIDKSKSIFDAEARKRSWAMFYILIFGQVAAWVETGFAANVGEGVLSLLEYGQRLGNLLPGTLGFSLLLIQFTQWVKRQTVSATPPNLVEAIVMGALIIFPVNIFVFVNAETMVDLVLGYGAFGEEEIAMTAKIIRVLVPSAFTVYVLNLMHVRFIVSNNDNYLSKIIMIAGLEVLLRLLLLWFLVPQYGVLGLVATMSLSPAIIVAITLSIMGRQWNFGEDFPKQARTAMAVIIASSLSFMAAMGASRIIGELDVFPEIIAGLVRLGIIGALQMTVYIALILMLGGIKKADMKRFLSRKA